MYKELLTIIINGKKYNVQQYITKKIKSYYGNRCVKNKIKEKAIEYQREAIESGNKSMIAYQNCFRRAKNFIGCYDEFIKVMESKFIDGMNWNTYGKWEIDHIIPLSKGGTHSVDNIQPLWLLDNRCKYNKIITKHV